MQERSFLSEIVVVQETQPNSRSIVFARSARKVSCLDLDHQHIRCQIEQDVTVGFPVTGLPNRVGKFAHCCPCVGSLVVKARIAAGFPAHPGRPFLDFIVG